MSIFGSARKKIIGLVLTGTMLFGSLPALAQAEAFPILRLGSTGSDVVILQEALREKGYYQRPTTEVFDEETQEAVIAFQMDHGLTPDGVAGQPLYDILFVDLVSPTETPANEATPVPTPTVTPTPAPTVMPTSAPTATPSPAVTPTPTAPIIDTSIVPNCNTYLRKGQSSGDQVKLLQQCLTVLGYYAGSINSNYDDATYKAVVPFQKASKLDADGIAGPNTLKALYTAAGILQDSSPSTPEPTTAPDNDEDDSKYDYILKKGMTTSQVGQLQQALEELGYYGNTSMVDAAYYYGDVTYAAVRKFQADYGLSVDGIAGPNTLKALFTRVVGVELTPPTSIPTTDLPSTGIDYYRYDAGRDIPIETVNWWEGGSGIIPRNAYFTVVDVRTGYTFRAKRMGGSRHIDYEPATKEDTAVLYAAYGNEWSWDRRPVWIIYNGRRIAGSTNGMPHGQQTILDNGMEGQVCIHLLGSSTHGSMNVDALHQACVKEAYNAGKK